MKSHILRAILVAMPIFGFAQQSKASPYTDPAKLAALIDQRKEKDAVAYLLVDVRTPAEYQSGHIPTAANIPVSDIGAKPPTDKKDALVVVYCRSGARSAAAKQTLERLGYTNVVDFGSVSRWTGALVKGDKPTQE
jgi:phage shock protein E